MQNSHLSGWVREMADLCRPDKVRWCDGSESEKNDLTRLAARSGEVIELDPQKLPGCLYNRSALNDVARSEQLTFICTPDKDGAGPTNNWMAPKEAYEKLAGIFRDSMKGRTMYVVPFIMGPADAPVSKVGVQITDSIYVVLNMRIMTRMGDVALKRLGAGDDFTRCLHGKADLNDKRRYVCHFPQDNTVWSVGSAYGGNALLGKKCLALRIGSYLGMRQGWMAEHMLIMGVENPQGKVHYVAAAFPSQCGKTNLAMIVPPDIFLKKGYKVWTVGDDIAWLWIGPEGELRAINPEAGFFGVAPGTNQKTNPNALAATHKDTIFTNVVLTKEKTVWWEGLEDPPKEALDWTGQPWTPESGRNGAHPNSRFTAPCTNSPCLSPEWANGNGVEISAIVFGGRHAATAPLIYETFDWRHGVYTGATLASETTAAATGQVGVLRRDPMAMLPFCGYHMGDYFAHWLSFEKKLKKAPKIFHVNWFRMDKARKRILWPGFRDNFRPILWALERIEGKALGNRTPIGFIPDDDALNIEGLNISRQDLGELLSVNKAEWLAEIENQNQFFDKIGSRLPSVIREEQNKLRQRLEKV